MFGKKKRSRYRKTRKRKVFSGVYVSLIFGKEIVLEDSEIGKMVFLKLRIFKEELFDRESFFVEEND